MEVGLKSSIMNKDSEYITRLKNMEKYSVWITLVMMSGSILSIFSITGHRLAESWSQTHNTDNDWLLYITLTGIMVTYLLRFFFNEKGDYYTLWKFKQKCLDLITSGIFFLVMVFGVNSSKEWISTMHIVFTAFAIILANIGMLAYPYERKMGLNGAIFASSVGVCIFIFAYFWPLVTTADGEMYVSLPLIVYLISTTNFKLLWKK